VTKEDDVRGPVRECVVGRMQFEPAPLAAGLADIAATLAERGERYGEYPEHARITQGIKRAMCDSPNWADLSDDKKECLEMVAHKIGRILNGDPEYRDSWHDIEGYVHLVVEELVAEEARQALLNG